MPASALTAANTAWHSRTQPGHTFLGPHPSGYDSKEPGPVTVETRLPRVHARPPDASQRRVTSRVVEYSSRPFEPFSRTSRIFPLYTPADHSGTFLRTPA